MLFRSARLRRIDRALSAILTAIDDDDAIASRACVTWRDLDVLAIATDRKRIAAYDRAAALEAQWQARVDAYQDQ